MFEEILGHYPIKAYLERALKEGQLPHAFLFSGPDGVGKSLFALALARHLLQTDSSRIEKEIHPDYHPIRPEGKSGLHAIETLRAMIDDVHSAPFEAPAKVFVLYNAERMQPAAANALLKILEEPNSDTTLILLTHSPRQLLPTILSRCVRLNFQPLKESEVATLLKDRGHPPKWAKFAQGSIGRALELAKRPGFEGAVFDLLSQRWPYHQLALQIEKLEAEVEDEDSVLRAAKLEQLFATILMWFRDQHARKMGVDEEHLFFPEQSAVSYSLPSLETIERAISEAQLGLERNMKFSACLERFLTY